jgi:electron transport complex protein RnfG
VSTPRFGALRLAALATVAAMMLVGLHAATRSSIAAAERESHRRVLWQVIPGSHDDLRLRALPVPEQYRPLLGLPPAGGELFLVLREQRPIAVIVPAVAQGYGGTIVLAVGLDMAGLVTGVRVLSHRETRGLGDDIELGNSSWILGFDGKSLDNPEEDGWRVKKDGGQFDAFTGATITPRAVVRQVHRALRYLAEDRDRLLRAAGETPAAPESANE